MKLFFRKIPIEPDVAGERILKHLHRPCFKGRKIIIREFIDRSWENDRRNHAPKKNHPINDLRHSERRQHSLKTVTSIHSQITFSSQASFVKKYG